jgi:hypothetical protein
MFAPAASPRVALLWRVAGLFGRPPPERSKEARYDGADFNSALFEAAHRFYAADIAAVTPHVGRSTNVYLPAGDGCFICTVVGARSSGGNKFLYARAATWVAEAKLHADQIPLPKASAADKSVAALLLDP